ncbi:hypothetical protein FG386_003012 [Cryptosporidium ryanae]|uniref:uncharacterized protein n=1 Tax=Cryptosporidium ryanae TaxID=515981 RepID=UPI003519EE54|nr:hypothetical protein FG386_003012 [Cryptosporidium ryanae]
MSSNYVEIYKFNDGFIKDKSSNISSIDKKLKIMLENFRKERRESLINYYRDNGGNQAQDNKNKDKNKRKLRHSRFYKEWKLALMWSKELIEYNWLNFCSDLDIIKESPHDWFILPLANGIRCMIIHGNGYCELRNEEGWRVVAIKNSPFKHSGLTIIDGIYEKNANVFHCNDIIVWNNLNMSNSPTECRLYILKSRIEENISFTNKQMEDVNMVTRCNFNAKKSISSINLKISNFYPLKKDNIIELYKDAVMDKKVLDYTHFLFINKDSLYLPGKEDHDSLESRNHTQIRYIWRDINMKNGHKVNKCDNDLSFRLELHENLLYTSNKVLIGKIDINTPEEVNEALSLEADQEIKLKEIGYLIVDVKFKTTNILNLLENFTSSNFNYFDINNKEAINKNLFDISNISAKNKMVCKSDNIDFIIFHCIEFIQNNTESINIHNNTSFSNLDIETFINSL